MTLAEDFLTRRPWPRLILIDLDGTLVDSAPDLAFCVDAMLERLGRPPEGEARVRHWVGNGVERLVRRALTGQLDGEPSETEFQSALPLFEAFYAARPCQDSRLYPGVRSGLEALARMGYRLGCVTSKAARYALPLLEALGIAGFFELIVAGDSLPRQKPDPLPLLHAARHFGVEPPEALMVGDSISDVQAARAAGFTIVCMSYGYNHGQDIRLTRPDGVIDSLVALPEWLEKRTA
ncbi:MAG: phosphoglycolate phosphatase [Pseudomonadota bacterium]